MFVNVREREQGVNVRESEKGTERKSDGKREGKREKDIDERSAICVQCRDFPGTHLVHVILFCSCVFLCFCV